MSDCMCLESLSKGAKLLVNCQGYWEAAAAKHDKGLLTPQEERDFKAACAYLAEELREEQAKHERDSHSYLWAPEPDYHSDAAPGL